MVTECPQVHTWSGESPVCPIQGDVRCTVLAPVYRVRLVTYLDEKLHGASHVHRRLRLCVTMSSVR